MVLASSKEGLAKANFIAKHFTGGWPGENILQWLEADCLPPDDHYEAAVDNLLALGATWLDVGGGKEVFPTNPALGRELAERCNKLVAVDPSENVVENRLADYKVVSRVEDYTTGEQYDLVTLRMVAEHIDQPDLVAQALYRLTKPGGAAVVLTPYFWSPTTLAAWLTPHWLHHKLKKLVWSTMEEDTFPVSYRLNTRKALTGAFTRAGFIEERFSHLDDCGLLWKFPRLFKLELRLWRLLRRLGIRYPERCLLAVYRKVGEP